MRVRQIMIAIVWVLLLGCGVYAAGAPNAPRPLAMKETLRIDDGAGTYLFKELSDIKGNARGEIFVQGDKQLLHFDAKGKFLGNLYKAGEGPGEIQQAGEFQIHGEMSILSGIIPLKLLFFNSADKLLREVKVTGVAPFSNYLVTLNGNHYCVENEMDFEKIKTGISPRHHQIYTVDEKGKAKKCPLSFETVDARVVISGKDNTIAVAMNEITSLLTACDGQKYMYVVDGERYLIQQFDWPAQKRVREIRLDFPRQAYVGLPDASQQEKELQRMANRKYFNDILALRMLGNDLLVLTSHIDAHKGVRVDRFNPQGQLVASVFLKIPGVKHPEDLKSKPLFFMGDDFWTTQIDEDDNPQVVRYRLDWRLP